MGGGTENITIDGNDVHDTGWDGIWSGGDVTAGVDHKNLKVLNNTIENTGIGDVTQGRHPIYLQSQDPFIEGNTITGPRDGNSISIRSSGIVRCNNVSGTSRTSRPAIRYYSNHEVGSTNLLVIEFNTVVSDTIGIDLYPPADRADGQSPPNHVVKNFIIRYNTVEGNPDIRVVREYYDDPIYSVEVYDNPPSSASPPLPDPTPSTVLLANFMNGNTAACHSRVYLFNPSNSAGTITVRVCTLPLSGGLAQELPGSPLDLGSLGAESALGLKLAEDVLIPLGIPTPYTTDGCNLTLEFTIQAAGVRGTAQVFNNSLTLAFGTYPLQAVPSTSAGSPTVMVADFLNGNTNFFKSRIDLFNPSASDGTVTLRVFTLPRTGGMAQELTTAGPHDLGTLAARSALNIRLEDILDDLSIPRPYETDSGNLTLEITIQAADVVGAAQVFNSSLTLAFGTYPMQIIQ